MKIDKYMENKNINYDDEEKRQNVLKEISYFLENYHRLTNKDYYKMICNFYDIKLEDKDYLNYINDKTKSNYTNIIKIETDVIDSYRHSEGYGRDFSWWDVKLRLCLKVAINDDIETKDKYFTIDEIKELIKENKIYPVCYFYEKCDDRLYVNIIRNDIEYLIKRKYGELDVNDEYFEYFINNIVSKIDLNEMFMNIRRYLVSYKNYLECYLIDYYFIDDTTKKATLAPINKVIDCYNEKIHLSSNEIKSNLIPTDPIELVMDYLNKLPNIDEKEKYKDIGIEQVINILETIDYDENKELCHKIEKMIIDLEDPELCRLVAASSIGEWINFDKMIDIIINSGDEWVCYDVLEDFTSLDDITRRRLIQVIIDSKNIELNYKVAKMDLNCIDIKEHGRVVIESKNNWYNFLFAQLEGADVRAHGEVIIASGDTYYNSTFPCYVKGADVEAHREVIRKKEKEENHSKKVKVKK